ncbi:MAG: hypothetical protein QOI31_3080 [Solirubrobacterales bacterium]|jgi:hypothetical protein|nr:hypothetical protein [Solirubrobacterales bacterium]
MSSRTAQPAIELAPQPTARPGLALGLALISIPGVTIAWDIGAGAGIVGVAVGIAAVIVGLQARSALAGARGTAMASVAMGIAGIVLLSVIVFLLVGAPE